MSLSGINLVPRTDSTVKTWFKKEELWSTLSKQEELNFLTSKIKEKLYKPVPFTPPSLNKRMEEKGDQIFKILSIDGGGIRGIIPLKLLAELEKFIGPISETFDLIAGTSTGGLIGLGVSSPFKKSSTADILDIYEKRSQEIFLKNPDRGFLTHKILNLFVDLPIYSGNGLMKLSEELCGRSLMKDAKTNLFISAVDTTDPKQPIQEFFTNTNKYHALLAMQDVACATTAAPSYFPQKAIGSKKYWDGGVCYNNPTLQSHLHAKKNGILAESQYILSLGTGFNDVEGIEKDKHNYPFLAKQFHNIVSTVQCNTIDRDLNDALGNRYCRISPYMEHEIELDDNSEGSLKTLLGLADQLVETNKDKIRDIAKILRPEKF